MANNSTPAMKHKVFGIDPQGIARQVPCPTQWAAEAEAKRRVARGYTDVEVQSWDSKENQFKFNVVANNHLIDADKDNYAEVGEDALEKLAHLGASQKALYSAAGKGKATPAEIEAFADELTRLAFALESTYVSREEGTLEHA